MEKEEKRYYLSPEQFDELKNQELHFINQNFNRPRQGKSTTRAITGLSLSGGGIRSAIFNLGVLQALAKKGLLQKIDYLSTVSGGGVIGSSLTWFLNEQTQKNFAVHYSNQKKDNNSIDYIFGTSNHNFPYGTDELGRAVSGENSFLQKNIIEYISQHCNHFTSEGNYPLLSLLSTVFRIAMVSLITWVPLISLIILFLININIGSFEKNTIPIAFEIGSLGLLSFIGFSTTGIIMIFICSFKTNIGDNVGSYRCRILADRIANTLFITAIIMIGIYLSAWIGTEFNNEIITKQTDTKDKNFSKLTAYIISFFSTITGVIAGLKGIFTSGSQKINKITLSLAAGLVAFGILLFSYQLAYAVVLNLNFTIAEITLYSNNLFYVGIVLSLTICMRTNLNEISIARFCGDRLKEVFMPDAESLETDNPVNFSEEVYLKDMCKRSSNNMPYPGPYHIINNNVILIDSKEKKYSRRGGDSFILSPLYCGSSATGWRKTSNYLKGELTLSTTMGISGVTINPHLRASRQSFAKNKLIFFVLEILNLRLGPWLSNPNPQFKPWHSFYPGNLLQSAWYGIKSWTENLAYFENAGCLQITDGGHFENLGVYELIRRELDLIIISDATDDATFTFGAFRNALFLAETDLKVEIFLDDTERLSMLLPNERKMETSPQKSYLSGIIRYSNNKEGKFIYLKSNIRLRSDKSPFDESQFDESQFNTYRDLGYSITSDMLENCDLTPLESRINKEQRRNTENRKIDLGYSSGNRRQQQRRQVVRRTA